MEGEKGRVCVTGGSGFVASWLIMKLLGHGYSVNTTIRPSHSENKRDISFLTGLPRAAEKLQIFQADLKDPESFNDAINGCTGVFHVATPVDFENKEPEEVVTRRAIEGTLGILKACLSAMTVKRVVYTSSASAVEFDARKVEVMDEGFWSDVDYIKSCDSIFGPYAISKTLTEKKALQFAEEHGLDLVTIIPSFIFGPFICPKFPGSVKTSMALILGNRNEYPILRNINMVHTDDVAMAHIFLFECSDAKGRYICSSNILTIEEMSKFLSTKYPEFPIPTLESLSDIIESPKGPILSSKKLMELGFKFKFGIEDMFDEAIQCCKEKGYL